MTEDEIRNLPAGREMDALVAQQLFGWMFIASNFVHNLEYGTMIPPNGWKRDNFIPDECPHYSTDIAAAWEVVEKMRGMALAMTMGKGDDAYQCRIFDGRIAPEAYRVLVSAETAPLAICRAALLAMESK